MTAQEYNSIRDLIMNDITGNAVWRWEMLKALWDLTRVIKSGLDE